MQELTTSIPVGGLTLLDHAVIGVYLIAMLAMGLSIARKQKSTDDFFVGGRNLPSWAVGISIFASLLSTITYLGMPGEMFRTGISFLTRQIPIPLVLFVVWALWIPFYMRLNLTSAYEYLERRFDYTARALAAVFCLLLLFGWISVVVLTASRAMAEITHLDITWFFGRNIAATPIQPDGSARISPVDLREDWPTLILKTQSIAQMDAPTPSKQIWHALDQSTGVSWAAYPDDSTAESRKQEFCDNLTSILPRRDFYDEASWASITLNGAARLYLKAGIAELSDREVTHLNRALLESAFPESIAESHPEYRDADMHLIIISIGLFSVFYTTLGGIRAVVWTDVIQFFVLMLGALFTMGAIAWMTNSGVGDWLETSRAYKHEQVEWFSWDVRNRSTVFSIAISMFFWFTCTHGANQVALQRYFSVGSVREARLSYLVSALASVGIGIILAGVGISLMYFIQHMELPAQSGINSAVSSIRNQSQDAVFPQFIRIYLPSGLRGMVVAALFAAAMSTIDSGANSVSTIATVDFFRRLNPAGVTVAGELKRARMLTAAMGVIVIVYTIGIYHMSKGTDIISLCQKGFNCFLGPLGAMFVLALFSKRAISATVIPAFLIGEIVGVGTSYSEELFDTPFSTHLVIPASWLTTIIMAHVFALVARTKATEEQQQWMWAPVLKTQEFRPGVESDA